VVSKQPISLQIVTPDEFLPPISRWLWLGGWALVGVFGGAIALAAMFEYNVTVKAPAVVRPEGDLRIVESALSGRVQRILVKANDRVEQGDAIAILDDAELRSREQQTQSDLNQLQRQKQLIQRELTALATQIQAETEAQAGTLASARAQLDLRQRDYRDQQAIASTDLQEAQAAVQFAQEELNRYQTLAGTGALADLQLKEKEAALKTARARLDKAKAMLDPSTAIITQAQQDIRKAQARGNATLATLQQTREALARQYAELDKQHQSQQQTLQQIRRDLEQLTIRTPLAGTIQALTLRNSGQVVDSGEAIAQIAPKTANLVIQAQVSQADISRIATGQTANLRIDSCPYPDFGVLIADVTHIPPDTQQGETTTSEATVAYQVTILPQTRSLQSGTRSCTLQAGMRGRADIITQKETILISLLRRLRLIARL
jgi:HlyD family secretion protein